MSDVGGMSGRVYGYSAGFHLAVVVTLYVLVHWHFFDRRINDETALVVQLVTLAPETRATQLTRTPPKPEKPPEAAEIPKPPELRPEPPKPAPPEVKPEPPRAEPAKPEVAKAVPPPPEPKPQEVHAEPKPDLPKPPERKPEPPKKKEDVMSDDLLRNLAKRSPTRTQEEAPRQVAAVPQKPSSQPIAPLGPQLTMSELDAIKQQLKPCRIAQAGAPDTANLEPEFRVFMNRDGTVRDAKQLNPERNSDPFFRAAAEAAARALRNPQCQPLKLPPEKYDSWQTFIITFPPPT